MKRLVLSLFLCFVGVYAITSSGRARAIDEYMIYFQTESLAKELSLSVAQAESLGVWYGRSGQDGQAYAPYGPAHAALLVPGYWAGVGLTRLPQVPDTSHDLLRVFAVVMSNALLGALLVCVFLVLLCRGGASPSLAVTSALGLGFGTLVWPYSGTLFSELWSGLLLLLAALALERATRASTLMWGALLAGICLAVAILVRPVHALAVPVFAGALLLARGTPGARFGASFALGAAAAVGLAALLFLNWHQYGSPWEFGYPEQAEGGRSLNSFETPLWLGLFGFLFSPGKSVLLFTPLLVAASLGLPRLWRERRPLALVSGGCMVSYLLFYSGYTQWEGGYCYGPRYLLPVLPLALLGLGTCKNARVVVGFAWLGVLVQVPGVFTSFLEEQVGGARYYDAAHNYQLLHQPWLGQMQLFIQYTLEALHGDALAAPLGKGLDLWWIYLAKGGVPWSWILTWLGIPVILLVAGAVWLIQLFSAQSRPDAGAESPRRAG
ncbi:MAG: hypothetical protein V3T77_07480 [Planctomycetota bacterium]